MNALTQGLLREMAVSVDWSSYPYLIEIPQSDCTLVEGTRYQITVDEIWQLLRDFSDGPEGSPRPITYRRIPATASTPAITEWNDPFYAAQFEDGLYSVDIINGNTNFRDVEVKNQVSVGTNNTTGFIDPTFLELGLFNGQVCLDEQNVTGLAVAGTGKTPAGGIIGTRQTPSNNPTDALAIAVIRGINTFNLMSDALLTSGDYTAGYVWTADRPQIMLTAQAAADLTGNAIYRITVGGELDGLNNLERALIQNITNVSGEVFQCELEDTIGVTNDIRLNSCYSAIEGSGYPTLTGIGNSSVIVRDMRGSIGLLGITGNTHSVGVYGGRIVVDGTGGTVHVRGDPYEVTDLSNGLVNIEYQIGNEKETHLWQDRGFDPDNPLSIDEDQGRITVGTTVRQWAGTIVKTLTRTS